MNIVKNLIDKAISWTGYLEKKSNISLDDFTANAGSNNYTCFARDYKLHTGLNYQGQAWCAMFVSEVFVQVFGVYMANNLLGGSLYHYCPDGVNRFKKAGGWHTKPEPGDVIFFTNGTRAYHTGIVIEVSSTKVKTIEGNTSGASGVIENGGGVCQKSYSLTESRIMGYGRPDWSIVLVKKSGWKEEDGGWRFYNGDTGECIRNDWHHDIEKDLWYWFDGAGMMITNKWYQYKGGWYYLNADGVMLKGTLIAESGKVYCLDSDGKMIVEPVTLTPGDDGALKYPGLVE